MADLPGKQPPLKVLVLAPSLRAVGGIERYLRTFVRTLGELLGEDAVRVLTLESQGQPYEGKEEERTDHAGTNHVGVRAKGRFICRAFWNAAAWRPDLIIAAHVGFAPLAWMLRGLWDSQYWVLCYGIEVWGALSFPKRQALARSTRVISLSDFTRQRLIECHGVPGTRIGLLPYVAGSATLPAAGLTASGLSGQGRRIVLTVSRLAATERYKGHDVLLQALVRVRQKVPDVLYLVVGDGNDRTRLEELALQLGLKDSVRFMGEVSDEMLASCYDLCHVFAMPSRTELNGAAPKGEGFGIVYLEAMAQGKPVLGPNFGAPTEFIRNGDHGLLVNPEDSEAIAAALIELLDAPERARRMGEAAREWVLREYSYPRFVERLRALLN